jgi:hypothetical protein
MAMTPKEMATWNRMRAALIRIYKGYQTPDQLRRNAERDFGCSFDETIEMSYENLQSEAKGAVRGVRQKKPKVKVPA